MRRFGIGAPARKKRRESAALAASDARIGDGLPRCLGGRLPHATPLAAAGRAAPREEERCALRTERALSSSRSAAAAISPDERV